MKKILTILIFSFFMFQSCSGQEEKISTAKSAQFDLSTLNLNEKITDIIDFDKEQFLSASIIYPISEGLTFSSLNSNSFRFGTVALDKTTIIFSIPSEKVKSIIKKETKDYSIAYSDSQNITDSLDAIRIMKEYESNGIIYAYQFKIKGKKSINLLYKELKNKYGEPKDYPDSDLKKGIWSLPDKNKYMVYTVDSDEGELLVFNNKSIDKELYIDNYNLLLKHNFDKTIFTELLKKIHNK